MDPHLYKATAGDVRELVDADLILYGGHELEGKMEDVFSRLADQRPTVAVTSEMPRRRLRAEPGFEERYGPHVWFDVDPRRSAGDPGSGPARGDLRARHRSHAGDRPVRR